MNAPAIRMPVSREEWEARVRRRYGLLEWPAMLRRLDGKDPSYAQ